MQTYLGNLRRADSSRYKVLEKESRALRETHRMRKFGRSASA